MASDDVTAAQLSEAYQDLVVYLERGMLNLVKINFLNKIRKEFNGLIIINKIWKMLSKVT